MNNQWSFGPLKFVAETQYSICSVIAALPNFIAESPAGRQPLAVHSVHTSPGGLARLQHSKISTQATNHLTLVHSYWGGMWPRILYYACARRYPLRMRGVMFAERSPLSRPGPNIPLNLPIIQELYSLITTPLFKRKSPIILSETCPLFKNFILWYLQEKVTYYSLYM